MSDEQNVPQPEEKGFIDKIKDGFENLKDKAGDLKDKITDRFDGKDDEKPASTDTPTA